MNSRSSSASNEARLRSLWQKHREHPYRKPISDHTRDVFESVLDRLRHATVEGRDVILDSGCGTGRSTAMLAKRHTDALVLGIDRSEHRLKAAKSLPDNALCLRAEMADFWRLCADNHIRFSKHYLLYPNPYPKSEHLLRRWHAHPIFPCMLELSGDVEMRTNEPWYADECAYMLELAGWTVQRTAIRLAAEDVEAEAMTAFERKYALDGQPLYGVSACMHPMPASSAQSKNP